jgi:hypothetical protein
VIAANAYKIGRPAVLRARNADEVANAGENLDCETVDQLGRGSAATAKWCRGVVVGTLGTG